MTLAELWERVRDRLLGGAQPHTRARGAGAERAAARYLRRQGYRILERNLQVAGAEVDLVAAHDGWLVVVEVRSYKGEEDRRPRGTLSPDKQHRLRRAAEELHQRPRWRERPVRVDLVEVRTDERDRAVGYEIIKGI